MLGDQQRKALRLIAQALLALSEDRAGRAAAGAAHRERPARRLTGAAIVTDPRCRRWGVVLCAVMSEAPPLRVCPCCAREPHHGRTYCGRRCRTIDRRWARRRA